MSDNIFFDTSKLKYRGNNVIIGKTVRIRYPELVELHDNVIIDDFTFISCGLIMHEHSFIENNCSLMGGKDHKVILGKHAAICNHVSAICAPIDIVNGVNINHHRQSLTFQKTGDIILEDYTAICPHSFLLPGVTVGEGARTSEFTRVSKNLDPWGLYYGISAKKIGDVNKESVLRHIDEFYKGSIK